MDWDRSAPRPEAGADSTPDASSEKSIPTLIDPAVTQKIAQIADACQRKDVPRLRSLAETRGGLISDDLRQQAWPLLIGLPSRRDEKGREHPDEENSGSWKELPRHHDEDQVRLDVDRSFVYYPNNQSEAELQKRKSELSALITEVLRRHPYLCYFQGYHDICQVFLLVLPPQWRAPVVSRLSVLRIRDFMLPSLSATTAQLRLLPDILDRADPKLRRHLTGIEPFYALSGTLTMYAHEIEAYHDISRLFDVFLAREPVFSIYMFAQIVIDRRDEIFEIDEADMLQVILGKVPHKMDFDALIADSIALQANYPPESLRSWRTISSASALKTARDLDDCAKQTLDEGREQFEKQSKELEWAEFQYRVKSTLWAYRRPAGLGTAIAVLGLAVYLNRNPSAAKHLFGLFIR